MVCKEVNEFCSRKKLIKLTIFDIFETRCIGGKAEVLANDVTII